MTRNRVIGKDGKLPWHLPDEMAYFRSTTLDKPIIMGRKTFDSNGRRPFPDRTNIVLSRHPVQVEGVHWVDSLADGFSVADQTNSNECFVIGGSMVYEEALEHATRLYETVINTKLDGDTFFPAFDRTQWKMVSFKRHIADKRHPYTFSMSVLERWQLHAPFFALHLPPQDEAIEETPGWNWL